MSILKQNIEDLKVIRSSYPENSRGYCALNLAIVTLSRIYATNEHILSIGAGSPHWVAGEGAGSVNTGIIENPGAFSGTITVEPGDATFTVEYTNA